jgi:hypothetical protein
MIRVLRWCRRCVAPPRLAVLALLATLSMGLTPTWTFAQNEPPPAEGQGESKGRELDGYILAGCFVGLTLFLVAKSARRTTAR